MKKETVTKYKKGQFFDLKEGSLFIFSSNVSCTECICKKLNTANGWHFYITDSPCHIHKHLDIPLAMNIDMEVIIL